FGTRAPLVDAMVGGWRGELDPDLRAAFASSGLMHLLAISGLHLLCLAGWVVLALRLFRVPRHGAEAVAALSMLGYAAFLGWPAAATRTAILLMVMAHCRWRQRAVRRAAALGVTLVVMLATNPWAVADVGAWLSVLGWSGVLRATQWCDRAIGTAWWIRSLSASTGALIATAPVAALAFGQVAPIAVILNVVGGPLVVTALPALFAALLLHHVVPAIAGGVAASGNVLLWLLQSLVRIGARAPGSATTNAGGWPGALPWLVALGAGMWMIHRRPTWREAVRRCTWVALTALCVTGFATPQRVITDDRTLALLFLDVGQGDAALIRTPRGHWIEVDAGPIGEGYDAGRRVVAPMLARQGAKRIDVFVLSHAHRDHVGGAAAVLDRVTTSVAIEPGELFADSAYDTWLDALHAHHARWRPTRAGTTWSLDGVRFDVLHPPSPWAREGEDLNEDSIVLEVEFGDFKALLMGDAGFVAESALAGRLPRVNVLKVGHHGSRTATSAAFLSAVEPQAAIVSVGRNRYGHPAPETLDRLTQAGVEVWRTDHEGTVTVLTDGRTFTVKGARAAAAFGTSR
ncbi:MAG: DNA internalization-related competence protein ComEC/Rec2, partial [Gemmatimonadales bacterium]